MANMAVWKRTKGLNKAVRLGHTASYTPLITARCMLKPAVSPAQDQCTQEPGAEVAVTPLCVEGEDEQQQRGVIHPEHRAGTSIP